MEKLLLAYYWLTQKPRQFKGLNNESIELKSPGYPSFLSGIVFKNCRLVINGQSVNGDVLIAPTLAELNMQSSLFFAEKTWQPILLIYSETKHLVPMIKQATTTKILIPSVELTTLQKEFLPRPANSKLIGKCGMLLHPAFNKQQPQQERLRKFNKILVQYAQTRLEIKSQQILGSSPTLRDFNVEQLLFEKIFESFGHKKFSQIFKKLAQDLPYKQIMQQLATTNAQDAALNHILAYWLGKGNLLDIIPADQKKLLPLAVLRNIWHQSGQLSYQVKPDTSRVTPKGHPVRRLLGMLQIIYNTKKHGILRSWLDILQRLHHMPLQNWQKSKSVKEFITPLFQGVKGHPYLAQSLTGDNRKAIVIVDGVLPVFLLLSREIKTFALSQTLFKFYCTFPGETTPNRVVKNMENRLGAPKISAVVKKSLAYSQGMLQISKDLCLTFPEGCQKCILCQWLEE